MSKKEKIPFFKRKWVKIVLVIWVILTVIGVMLDDEGGDVDNNSSSSATSQSSQSSQSNKNFIGEWAQGKNFKVGVIDVKETKYAPVEYMCDNAPAGSRYVMVNIAIENTDSKTRMMMTEGEIHVRYEGDLIKYTATESCTLGQDGYLNFLEEIGPFIRKEGRITFVIPDRFAVEDMVYLTPRDYEKIYLKQKPAESN